MDDLDRLAFRLVRTIRQNYPHLREHGFTLSDLEERLLPFRDSRREMADSGADAWEKALLRLISGEREYVRTDVELQAACRSALALPSPTMALVRSWATTSLVLGAAVERVGTERVSGAFEAARMTELMPSLAISAMPVARPIVDIVGAVSSFIAVSSESAGKKLANVCCRFCSGRLPEGRRVTFCPHCGVDQTKRQCPACSTELDAAWRFCVTCGRSADLPDLPNVPMRETRAAS